jgi:hypothetical protein
VAEFVFVLMPFRHNQNISRLQNILHQIDSREMEEQQGLELLNKFRKQTLRRLQHLQDRSKVSCLITLLPDLMIITSSRLIILAHLVLYQLDSKLCT